MTRYSSITKSIDANEIIDSIPVGVAILDMDLRVQAMNRSLEAMTGFNREEALGVSCPHILRSNLCPQKCPAKQALDSGQATHVEGNIINRARQKIPVMIHVAVLKDGAGEHIGVIETIEDISLIRELDRKVHISHDFSDLVGHSPKMQRLFDILPVISQTDSSVLITGETGTGKDLVASVIHRLSPRAQGPFIKINCGALPETLLESELFGHIRGAFTGAVRDKPGRLQLAESGTVYLTEIGDLPLALQVKLLTFLDDKEIVPLGGTRSVKTDVRLVAATHRDLQAMVREGSFREDLLYRLNVIRLEVPPLREREGDIRLLMEYFLNQFNKQFQKKIRGLAPKTIEILTRHPYPGNVRELMNIVEYGANVCHQGSIQPEHLPDYLMGPWEDTPRVDFSTRVVETTGVFSPQTARTGEGVATQKLDWREMERRMISEALLQTRGNRTKAAKLLGWGRSTLWRKMKQHNLD
ncbi:MAG: sigma 54-interacting transcriptional regulator [Syntrophobacteria bacterium]